MRMLASVLGLVGLLVLDSTQLLAQAEPPPTPDDLTLRPGDTITWTVNTPHKVRFGGSVSFNNASLDLTPFKDVQNILDLDPALTADDDGIALGPTGTNVKVTGKVKATASAGAQFFFTCGFPQHSDIMVTVAFTVAAPNGQPARNIEIVSKGGPIRWVLKTAAGDRNLNRPTQ
jgi:hypothetical protein